MKKKLPLLLAGFIVCYYAMHIAYDLPNLVHGTPNFAWLPAQRFALAARLADMVMASLFALLPYIVLHTNYPKGKTVTAVLMGLACVVSVFFMQYALTRLLLQPIRLRNFF